MVLRLESMDRHEKKRDLRVMLTWIFAGLSVFLIALFVYKHNNPYAYPGLEDRVPLVLAPIGMALLYLYLDDEETWRRIFGAGRRVAGMFRDSRCGRFGVGMWQRVSPPVRARASDGAGVLSVYLRRACRHLAKEPGKIVSYAFLGLLLLMVAESVVPQMSLEWAKTPLMVATVVAGAVTFYLNRGVLEDVEEEARLEEIEEKRREAEFGEKYPRINRVWGVRWVARWGYKEGWWYSGGLVLLVFIAFSIRVYNLTILYPYTDEYAHLIAAKSLLETGTTDYTRAYFLSYTIYILFKIFGPGLFIARIPGVFFGALTVIPIYFLVNKISKPAALVSAWLWTISPWAVMVSRNAREYAIFPFFMIFYLIFLIYFAKRVSKIVDGQIKYTLKEMSLTLLAILPFIYAYTIDPLSSFKQITLLIPAVGLYIVYEICMNGNITIKKNKKTYAAIIVLVSGVILVLLKFIAFTRFRPHYDYRWMQMFFKFDIFEETCWYTLSSSQLLLVLLTFFGIWYVIQEKKDVGIAIVLVCFIELYFLCFHFDRYMRPRYAFFVLPVFLSIVGLGIYQLYRSISNLTLNSFARKSTFILITILLLTLFNPIVTYTAITHNKHGYVPWTTECHDYVKTVADMYKDKIKSDDILITSMPGMLIWYFDRPLKDPNIYEYNYTDEDRFNKIDRIVSKNNAGWIILDWRRNGRWTEGLPKADFETGGKEIKFLGEYDGFQVYRWIRNVTQPMN